MCKQGRQTLLARPPPFTWKIPGPFFTFPRRTSPSPGKKTDIPPQFAPAESHNLWASCCLFVAICRLRQSSPYVAYSAHCNHQLLPPLKFMVYANEIPHFSLWFCSPLTSTNVHLFYDIHSMRHINCLRCCFCFYSFFHVFLFYCNFSL